MKQLHSAIILCILLVGHQQTVAEKGNGLIGKPAPDWGKLRWINSHPLQPNNFTNKVLLVQYWATDRPLCSHSWLSLYELQKVCRERGITIRGTKADVVLRLRRNDEGLLGNTVDNETEAPSEEAVEVELDAPVEETAVTEGENNATDSEQGELIDKEE